MGTSIPANCSVPIHAILLLPLRHVWCSQSFPPTYRRRHQRNRSLTRDILRNQEEHRRAGLLRSFPLCSSFSKNSTIFPLVSCVKSIGTFGWNPSHPTPVFALYNLDAFSNSPSFTLDNASSHSFNSSFLHGLSCTLCISSLHCQMFLTILFFLLHNGPTTSHLLPLSPRLWLCDFFTSPALPSALLIMFSTLR